MSKNPILSFGLITDIQYADANDALNYRKDKVRYYRNSINLVREAVEKWHENFNENKFKFIIQLGDIIDGKAEPYHEKAVNIVLNELKSDFKNLLDNFNLYHIWGNHEFYNYERREIIQTELNSARLLNLSVCETANYYIIELTESLKIICLDFYDFAAIGHNKDSEIHKNAVNFLRIYNKNSDLNKNEGMVGLDKRFTALNGALGSEQMKWLEDQLIIFKDQNKKAIICGHIPVHIKTTTVTGLVWNYEEMLELFSRYSGVILAYLSGHEHVGGYFKCDKTNIHHLTVPAIVESPPGTNSFATVKVYEDKVFIEGFGLTGSYEIPY
jgi:manganese-dependent ADP-ribose/CDP-alcohol diphosphatase